MAKRRAQKDQSKREREQGPPGLKPSPDDDVDFSAARVKRERLEYREVIEHHGLSQREIHTLVKGALCDTYSQNMPLVYGKGDAGWDRAADAFQDLMGLMDRAAYTADEKAVLFSLGSLLVLLSSSLTQVDAAQGVNPDG